MPVEKLVRKLFQVTMPDMDPNQDGSVDLTDAIRDWLITMGTAEWNLLSCNVAPLPNKGTNSNYYLVTVVVDNFQDVPFKPA